MKIRSKILAVWVAGIMSIALARTASATATVSTLASSSISADTTGGAYAAITGPVLDEGANRDISAGTIVLNAPTGFAFDTSSPVTVAVTRLDAGSGTLLTLSSANATVAASTVTITVSAQDSNSGNPKARSRLTWSGIKVRPTAGTPLASGNITKSGTSSISGSPSNYGTLTEIAGAASKLAFTTQPAGAVYATPFTTQPVVKTTDQFGNLSSSGLGATLTVSLTLTTGTGPLAGTTTANIGTGGGNGTVSFSSVQIDRVENGDVLTASATSFTAGVSSAFNVTTKALTVSGAMANNKIYDGTTVATLNVGSAILNGVAAADIGNVSLNSGSYTATFVNQTVGVSKAVTVSGLALTGSAAANYTLTQPSPTADITAKPLTVAGLTAGNKIYDGLTTATLSGTAALLAAEAAGTGTTSDGKPYTGDTVTLGGTAAGNFISKDVGNGVGVTVTGKTLSGAQSSNYIVTQPTGLSANITTKALTMSGLTASNKVYDGLTTAPLGGTAALLAAEAPGAGTTSDGKLYTGDTATLGGTAAGTFATKDVGTGKAVTVTGNSLTGAQSGNYTLTQQAGLTANVTAKALTVTGLTANDKGYDALTSATLAGTAALLTDEAAGAGTTSDGKPYTGDAVTLGGTAVGTFADRNVALNKAVTITGNTISGAQAGNYTLTQQTGLAADISAKALTVTGVTAGSKVYDGLTTATLGGTAALLAAEAPGAGTTSDGKPYTGDTVTVGGTAVGAFASKDVGSGVSVTVTGKTLSGAQSGNYIVTQPTGLTANITAKALTVSGLTASNKVYDGLTTATLGGTAALLAAEAPGAGTTSDGKRYTGDTVTLGGTAAGTFATKDVGTGKAVTITGNSISGVQSGNYTLTQQAGLTANITVKALTVSGLTANDKVYDGLTTATMGGTAVLQAAEVAGTGTTSDGKPYTGDTVMLGGTAAGTFVDRHVGAGKAVTITGSTISGAQAGNYSLTQQAAVTADITPKALTVSGITASNKIYDGSTVATLGGTAVLLATEAPGAGTTSDGKPYSGDTVTLGGTAAGTFVNKDVGSGVSVSVTGKTLSGAQAGNYTVTQPAGVTANITPKALTVSGLTANNKVYDALTTASLTGTAALLAAEAPGAGTTSDGKPYTGDTVTLGGTAAGTFASKDVGTGKAVTVTGSSISGAQAGNYTLTQQAGLTANITAKALTVSGLTASGKVYDGLTTATLGGTAVLQAAEAAGTGSTSDGNPYTGDTVTLGGTAAGTFATKDVGTAKSVTVTGKTISGAQAGNYSVTQPTGLTADITTRTLTVTADDKNKPYGQPVPVLTASYSGFASGETLATSGVSGSPSLTTTATTNSPAGTYPITPALGTLTAVNYSFTYVSGTLTVSGSQSEIVLTSSITPSIYGQSVVYTATVNAVSPATGIPTGTVDFFMKNPGGLMGTATVDASGIATITYSGLEASTYPKLHATYNGDSNFAPSDSPFYRQTVVLASTTTFLTSSVTNSTYGQDVTFAATVNVVAPGIGIPDGTVTFTSNGTNVFGVGTLDAAGHVEFNTSALGAATHAITANYNGSTNFIGSTTLTLTQTVAKAALTLIADSHVIPYGSAIPTLTFTYDGFVNSESLGTSDVTGSPAVSTTAVIGSVGRDYPITIAPGTLQSGNYAFQFLDGTLDIFGGPTIIEFR